MRQFQLRSAGTVAAMLVCLAAAETTPAVTPADRVYRNGIVFTADVDNPQAEALAIRDGRIVYVGGERGVAAYIGDATVTIDLGGRFLMPGIVDGHMHPLDGGDQSLQCDLNYESLTVAQFQQHVQACLDKTAAQEPNTWLEVDNWFQETMRPPGVTTSRLTLDALRSHRPIIVFSSQGHTALANSRALALAGITRATPDPVGGKLRRDSSGEPTGLLENKAAFSMVSSLLPTPTEEENVAAAAAALAAMNRQGVTSFLDAHASNESMAAFTVLQRSGKLTARAHFAPGIEAEEATRLELAVARVIAYRAQYDEGPLGRDPSVTVRNAKLFLDGIIFAPAFTAAMLDPYLENAGTPESPRWVAGHNSGPAVYFPRAALAKALTLLGRAGIDPHMHADGDGAVRAALDAIATMRKAVQNPDVRPAIAHDEIVSPQDFARFKALKAIAVLSFQWEQPAGYTLGLKDYFGPERMKILEPAGLLARAGARIAFGSDWPVDPLDEWFAFKVGVTRTSTPDAAPEYRGRLGADPGLSRAAVLRAATIDAAYELHEDDVTGSLQIGKLADLIVVDRNPLTIAAEDIANVRVLEAVVGGRTVFASSTH